MQGLEFPSTIEYHSFVNFDLFFTILKSFWKSNKRVVFATPCTFLLNGILIVKFKKTVLPVIWYEKKIYLVFLLLKNFFLCCIIFVNLVKNKIQMNGWVKHITVNALPFHWNNFTKLTFIWLSLVNGETFSV